MEVHDLRPCQRESRSSSGNAPLRRKRVEKGVTQRMRGMNETTRGAIKNPSQTLDEVLGYLIGLELTHFACVFSRMRSKGSRFTLGVWGLRVCSLDVASASATVRNRSQPSARSPYGRAYGKFCRRGPFWRFQTCRCFVSCGRRGTPWHSDVFWNVSKVVLRGRRNTFATFSEDVLQFSWQAQHFGRVHCHFSWQAQHFRRVVLRVFCKSHWQGCVKWRQGANSVAVVAFCAMCWKLTEASHETSILRLPIFRF